MLIGIDELWYSDNEKHWDKALEEYWRKVKPENIELEKKLEKINPMKIKEMSIDEFYNFLYKEYFVWKYTAANRLATTRNSLKKYELEDNKLELEYIQKRLFTFNKDNIKLGIEIASGIRGLGVAGASGLLSILFPKYFATVDQFVVKSLLRVNNLEEHNVIKQMKPENLKSMDAEVLIKIMRDKANELNNKFNTDIWTPRKIDKILWTIDR